MKSLKSIFEEIKDRKIRKWITIHLSTSLTIIGVIHLFSLRYDLPAYIFDNIVIILGFGLLITIILAWFHGKEGKQKTSPPEIILLLLVFILLVTMLVNFNYSGDETYAEVQDNSIAVLPFKNLNDSKEDEYFSDGVTEDIITNLSKISGLKVISRTTVMNFKNSDKGIREIGKELGVKTILEGSVRRSGSRIRVVGQLINASDDTHIWSETYDRELEDIFAIQSEIAEKIAAALETNLLPLEKKLIDTKSTKNIDAYTFYLKGRHHYYNYTSEENERAIELFKQALKIDPGYALALAGLADAYNQRVGKYWYSEEWYDSALTISKRALEIDPELPEAYKAIALTYDNIGKKDLALSNYERAIKLNPNFASAILNYGQIKLSRGSYDEALYWFRRANTLEPDNIWGIISIGNLYKLLQCDSLAIHWGEKAVSLNPNVSYTHMILGEYYLYAGNLDESRKHISNSVSIDDSWILGWFYKGQIEAVAGNYKLSKEYIDKYMQLAGTNDPEYFYAHNLLKINENKKADKILEDEKKEYVEFLRDYPDASSTMDYYALAEIYAILNEKENAFKAWKSAVKNGWLDSRRATLFPYFENLRNEPEYRSFIESMDIRIDSLKSIIKNKYSQFEICE